MIRERKNMGGASFKSHNENPCPGCFMWNSQKKKCVPIKGYYCKILRNEI